MSNNRPSIDPADNGTLAGMMKFVFSKLQQGTDGMLPAKVIKYDREANRVQVQLLIRVVGTDGTLNSRSQIASLPVLVLGGGGFMVNFPLNAGDLGWVIANDRDISNFLQYYDESNPNSSRVKSFSDGLFVPDVMTDYTINGEDDDRMVISSTDGLTRVAIGDGVVKVTVGDGLTETSYVSVTPTEVDINVTGAGGTTSASFTTTAITIMTPLVVNVTTPLFQVFGNIQATGVILPGTPP